MADLAPTALVAAVESSYRLESVLVARRLAAVAGLLRHRAGAAEQAEREHGYAVIVMGSNRPPPRWPRR